MTIQLVRERKGFYSSFFRVVFDIRASNLVQLPGTSVDLFSLPFPRATMAYAQSVHMVEAFTIASGNLRASSGYEGGGFPQWFNNFPMLLFSADEYGVSEIPDPYPGEARAQVTIQATGGAQLSDVQSGRMLLSYVFASNDDMGPRYE